MAKWTGIEEAVSAFSAIQQRVSDAGRVVVDDAVETVSNKARSNMGGPGPRIRSGALAESIHGEDTVSTGTGWTNRVGPFIVYGRIQELGGVIRPKRARFLRFPGIDASGKFGWVYRRSVTLPARPYLRPAASESKSAIRAESASTWGRAIHG